MSPNLGFVVGGLKMNLTLVLPPLGFLSTSTFTTFEDRKTSPQTPHSLDSLQNTKESKKLIQGKVYED